MSVGEFINKMRDMHRDTGKSNAHGVREKLIELFSTNGPSGIIGATSYSKKENNQDAIRSPALSLLAEGQPKPFYDLLDASYLDDGFLGRWTIFEHAEFNRTINEKHDIPVPDWLVSHIKGVEFKASQNESNGIQAIVYDQEADVIQRRHRAVIEERLATSDDLVREVWARVYEKTKRLAGLLTAFDDPFHPVITAPMYNYARGLTEANAHTLETRLTDGDVGVGESRRCNAFMREVAAFLMRPDFPIKEHDKLLREAGVVPYRTMSQRLRNTAAFRSVRQMNGGVIESTVKVLINSGLLLEVSPTDPVRTSVGQLKAQLFRPSADALAEFRSDGKRQTKR
jgi:hypothetical protein